ncbi:MAG TPA: methionyl-tRNA formyltransferase [Woeseiaceae bacterium]|jgi:methionyl-tRNA formyltransferase|nr:methionyl-tRNA formyltransferase [Woeseiaceae bacterium]
MSTPRIIFAGTPEFSVVSLRALVESGKQPVAVLTQPDRPAGRGKRLTPSPVKQYAEERGIPVLQPQTLRDAAIVAELAALEADIMVVAAYGLILPQAVLDLPASGCLNVHASLLPRWRGAAPIQAAILAGDEETGVCLMAMTAGLDCGPVYVSESVAIGADDTAGELHDRLAAAGGRLLARHVDAILAGELLPREQDESAATYAPKIVKADAELDWTMPAEALARVVRAYNPVPGAWFVVDGVRIKCWQARVVETAGGPAGRIEAAGPEGVTIACARGALRLESVQRPGKRAVTGGEFASQVALVGKQL